MNLTVASRHKFPQAIAIWAYPEQPGKFPQVVVGGCYDDHCHHNCHHHCVRKRIVGERTQ